MFILDPFDIAPNARRHTPAAWMLLVVSVAFCLWATAVLARTWKDTAEASRESFAARQALQAQTRKEAALTAESAREPQGARARLELQRVLNVSWTGLFEVLEGATKAVDGRVTIAALAPVRLRPEGAELGITALAVNTGAMLQYLQTVQSDVRVRQVQLVSQQTGSGSETGVIRFQATLLLERPAGATPSSAGRTTHASGGGNE